MLDEFVDGVRVRCPYFYVERERDTERVRERLREVLELVRDLYRDHHVTVAIECHPVRDMTDELCVGESSLDVRVAINILDLRLAVG